MRVLFVSIAAFLIIVAPQLSVGSDLDDLKAADDRGQRLNLSLDPNDVEAYVAMFNDEFLYVDSEEGFPVRSTRDQLRQAKKATIAALESQGYIMQAALYSVAGNTGVVCHYGTEQQKPKGGPAITRNVRWTITLTKVGGKWLIHAAHASVMPAGD